MSISSLATPIVLAGCFAGAKFIYNQYESQKNAHEQEQREIAKKLVEKILKILPDEAKTEKGIEPNEIPNVNDVLSLPSIPNDDGNLSIRINYGSKGCCKRQKIESIEIVYQRVDKEGKNYCPLVFQAAVWEEKARLLGGF